MLQLSLLIEQTTHLYYTRIAQSDNIKYLCSGSRLELGPLFLSVFRNNSAINTTEIINHFT